MKPYKKYYVDGVQAFMFGQDVMKITNGVLENNHVCRLAIDIAGADAGISPYYAGADGKITYKEKAGAKTLVIFSTLKKVKVPDGNDAYNMEYVNQELYHDNDISDLWVGKYIQQGEPFYQEGTAGNSFGNHIHTMFSFGEYDGKYPLEKTQCNNWRIKNQVHPERVMFIDDTTILKDKGYNWKKVPESSADSGIFDDNFFKRIQASSGTTVDGIMSGQLVLMTNVPVMEKGTKGSEWVRWLQRFLNTKGNNLKVDGQFGPITLKAWQKYVGTVSDGCISQNSEFVKRVKELLAEGTLWQL